LGTVQTSLARRRDGTFQQIATRSISLEMINGDLAIFGTEFRRPQSGRCRIKASFTEDGITTTSKHTFDC
jgi:hypothetical protein